MQDFYFTWHIQASVNRSFPLKRIICVILLKLICNDVVRATYLCVKFPFCSSMVDALSSLIGASLFASCVAHIACARDEPRIVSAIYYRHCILLSVISNSHCNVTQRVIQLLGLRGENRHAIGDHVLAAMPRRFFRWQKIFLRATFKNCIRIAEIINHQRYHRRCSILARE